MMTLLSVLLAATIGFASHRASLCTVRAVAEVMNARSAYMLVGFGVGAVGWLGLDAALSISEHAQVIPMPAAVPKVDDSWTLIFLWAWAPVELFALLIPAIAPKSLHKNLLAPTYRLSTAAALLGIAGGILHATQGSWTYTSFCYSTLAVISGGVAPTVSHALLVGALLLGMTVSSVQRKSFELKSSHQDRVWVRRFAGGCLMGIGGALMPGGNDTLLLSAMPALSSQALFAFGGLVIGIAVSLAVMRIVKLPMSGVHCANDECREVPIVPHRISLPSAGSHFPAV